MMRPEGQDENTRRGAYLEVQLDELIADSSWSENTEVGEQQADEVWRRVVPAGRVDHYVQG